MSIITRINKAEKRIVDLYNKLKNLPSGGEVDLPTKLDKVSTEGLERTYIINADGSQSTKATSDFNTSADNGLNTSNDPKVVELGGRLIKDTMINIFNKSLAFFGVEDSGFFNIGTQPPYPTTFASLEIGTGTAFGFLKRGLQFFSNKTIVKGGTIEQDVDRSLEYTDRSLVDKQYVKGILSLNQWYGVEWDITVSNSALSRIGSLELHQTLPIQSKMRRCLLLDNGTVNYYLDANNSTLKEDATPANLTGADGQVMVETPEHYIKHETDGNVRRIKISEFPLIGYTKIDKFYRSAYEASLQRSNLKLSSVVNNSVDFRGGNNNATYDALTNTLLGRPVTSVNLTNFRQYARNRGNGTKWNCDVYFTQLAHFHLYLVEFADRNSQLPFNPVSNAQGFKQGGLGSGVTDLSSAKWSNFNGYNPFIPCGHTNILGNRTGQVAYVMPELYDAVSFTTFTPSYRGLENPFGHIFKWTDGCKINVQSNDSGGNSIFYKTNNPANFQDTNYTGYDLIGNLARQNGYVKNVLSGENLASEIGAGTTTYFSDYFDGNIPASGEIQRGVLFGGAANYGASAGLSYAVTNYAPSYAFAYVGSRLCFIP